MQYPFKKKVEFCLQVLTYFPCVKCAETQWTLKRRVLILRNALSSLCVTHGKVFCYQVFVVNETDKTVLLSELRSWAPQSERHHSASLWQLKYSTQSEQVKKK